MGIFARKIGIDLGSSRTRVVIPRKGVVLDEPSIIARDTTTRKIVAVGDEALDMAGKTPETIVTEYPLQRGVIADFGATAVLLRSFLQQATGRYRITKPELMLSVSMTATSTEQRAVIEAGESAGAQDVHLILPTVAAALGSRLEITEPRGNMVIDCGAGTTEIAVISLGGIVAKRAIRTGGNAVTNMIATHLRRQHGIIVGDKTAEDIKCKIGTLHKLTDSTDKMSVSGRSSVEGLPKTITLRAQDIPNMITPVYDDIVRSVRSVIEQTSPELVSDIKRNGILLSGGAARLHGLDSYLSERLNSPCGVVERPSHAVARGTQRAMQHLEEYQKSLLSI